MDNLHTTVSKGRITKQGVRDLNYYGPRRAQGVAEATATATVADEKIAPEAATEVHEKDAIK